MKTFRNIFLIIFGVVVVIIAITYLSSPKEEKQPANDKIKMEAKVMARTIIQEQLKAPTTAKFGREYVSMKDSVTYVIQNTVDAQNSFGAMIRNNYQVTLKYLGGDPENPSSWQIVDTKIE